MARDKSKIDPAARPRQRSFAGLGAFLFGPPAGIGILLLLSSLPADADARRYVHNPVEQVEVIMFCCAMGALLGKVLGQWNERRAFRRKFLPDWDGCPRPIADSAALREQLDSVGFQKTHLFRRTAAVLDFVRSRGSADELDDQIRALADGDVIALEGTYAFIRLIIWAIPILGFLGTVLGITGAISGVTPEVLEHSLSTVTDGLSMAFDTTALALGLTMVLMFANSMVDRLEQRTLEAVDRYVDEHLAHRFERASGGNKGEVGPALRQQADFLMQTAEQLVERQAVVWTKSMDKTERALAEGSARQQDQFRAAIERAMESTLVNHQQRLLELEKQSVQQVSRLAEKIGAHTEMLGRLQAGETQLIKMQEKLQQNLAVLAQSGAFEQAVQSLTAAIHLLTAKTGASAGRFNSWPAKAA